MSSYTVEDPDEVTEKRVNDSGQVYVGRKYAGQVIQLSVKEVEEE